MEKTRHIKVEEILEQVNIKLNEHLKLLEELKDVIEKLKDLGVEVKYLKNG